MWSGAFRGVGSDLLFAPVYVWELMERSFLSACHVMKHDRLLNRCVKNHILVVTRTAVNVHFLIVAFLHMLKFEILSIKT